MSAETVVSKSPDVAEKIGSITMLFDSASGRLFELNESGKKAWVLIDGKRSLGEVAEAISMDYGIDKELAMRDLLEFVKEMLELGILKIRR